MSINEVISAKFYNQVVDYFKDYIIGLMKKLIIKKIEEGSFNIVSDIIDNREVIEKLDDIRYTHMSNIPSKVRFEMVEEVIKNINNKLMTNYSVFDLLNFTNDNIAMYPFMKEVKNYIISDNIFSNAESDFYYSYHTLIGTNNDYGRGEDMVLLIKQRCVYDIVYKYMEDVIAPLFDDIVFEIPPDIIDNYFQSSRFDFILRSN